MIRLKKLTLTPLCLPHPRLLIRLSLAFIVAISLWFLIRDPLVEAHVYVANVALRLSGNGNAQIAVTDSKIWLRIAQPAAAGDNPVYRSYPRSRKYGLGWCSIFYLILCLCVPWSIAKKRWWYLCLVALLFFSIENYHLIRSALRCVTPGQAKLRVVDLISMQSGRNDVALTVYSRVLLALPCLLFLPLLFAKPGSR